MGKRRRFGMTEQQVYNHLDGLPSLDAKIGFLWRVIDKRNLITENTETPVLNVLKRLHKTKSDQYSDLDKYYENLSEFGKELIVRGFVSQGNKAIEEADKLLNKYVESSKPQSRNFEMYSTRREFYGCGYEDSTTSYDGFDEKGFSRAWENYDNLEKKIYEKLKKSKPILSIKENSNKDVLTPFEDYILEKQESEQKIKDLEKKVNSIENDRLRRRNSYLRYEWRPNDERLEKELEEDIDLEIKERTKRLDYENLSKVYEIKEKFEENIKSSYSIYDKKPDKLPIKMSEVVYDGFVLTPKREFPENELYQELDKKRKRYNEITKPYLDKLIVEGKFVTAKKLGRDLDLAFKKAKKEVNKNG